MLIYLAADKSQPAPTSPALRSPIQVLWNCTSARANRANRFAEMGSPSVIVGQATAGRWADATPRPPCITLMAEKHRYFAA